MSRADKIVDRIRLYIVEEQELFAKMYEAALLDEPTIDLLDVSENMDTQAILVMVLKLKPSMVLLGTKTLDPAVIDRLEAIRASSSDIGLVLLSSAYTTGGMKRLRDFARTSSRGCAFLLKQGIDRRAQLVAVIHMISNGQVILDPLVMEGLIDSSEPGAALLRDLSGRELEVLNWIAKGLKNSAIAEVLCLEPKTVERHINSIFSKLGLNDGNVDSRHARVGSVILYLKATGQLVNDLLMRGQTD